MGAVKPWVQSNRLSALVGCLSITAAPIQDESNIICNRRRQGIEPFSLPEPRQGILYQVPRKETEHRVPMVRGGVGRISSESPMPLFFRRLEVAIVERKHGSESRTGRSKAAVNRYRGERRLPSLWDAF